MDGVLTTEDARAINAPLIAQRVEAQLRLTSLPARRAMPGADEIEPTRFREAVLLAWQRRPLDDRREALDRLLERITLHEGGADIEYAVRDGGGAWGREPSHDSGGFRHHEPPGPPSGAWGQCEIMEGAALVRPPVARRRSQVAPGQCDRAGSDRGPAS